MENRIRKIVITGIFSALVLVLGWTGLGFIPLPLGAVTVLQVPVIIAAILEGPVPGLLTGLFFGVFSYVQAGVIGVTPVDMAFLAHPWIAILPRILIGPAAWLVYSLVSGSFFPKNRNSPPRRARETAAAALGAVCGSMINTVLVLGALGMVLPEIPRSVLLGIAALNGTVEAGFSAAIALAVILPWKGVSARNRAKIHDIRA